jgi:hypothetical protein
MYKIKKQNSKKWGKLSFLAGVFILLSIVSTYVLFAAPDFPKCDSDGAIDCTCPIDKSKIGDRSIVLIDTTDPLRNGKYGDVDRILSEITSQKKPLLQWLRDGKTSNQISVYILADKNPADMQPIATFCQIPPDIALIASDMSASTIRKLEASLRNKVLQTLESAKQYSSASSSPIVESLAVLTGNSSSWTPGGDLIIVSDMIENSEKCGWFNSMEKIPPFSNAKQDCKNYARNLIENIKPTSTNPNISAIAVCSLPRSSSKSGVRAFWSELFQSGLGFDIAWTCDPREITSRHFELNNKRK